MTAVATPRRATLPSPGIAAVGFAAVAAIASAGGDDGVVLCPIRRCTGGYCPGCGATRAANRLIRGDVAASWSYHPWIAMLAVQIAVVAGWFALTRRDPRLISPRLIAGVGVANAIALLAIWIIRLDAGTIPSGWL